MKKVKPLAKTSCYNKRVNGKNLPPRFPIRRDMRRPQAAFSMESEGKFMTNPIEFDLSIGKKKPYSSKGNPCPFCDPGALTHILDRRGDMIWCMNKYPVFHGTWPTVLIETSNHDDELSRYAPEKLHDVIRFGMEKWEETEKNPAFRSVIYFRNYGPHSGGSQRHPHSQIIGLYDYDYRDNIATENFLGAPVYEDGDCYVTLSDYPICSMAEFNISLKKEGNLVGFADAIQHIARFVLTDFPIPCDSYNLFFYHLRGHVRVKVFPRYIASPLYMGYRITQVVDSTSRQYILDTLRSESYFG